MNNTPGQIIIIGGSGAIGQAMVKELLTCFPSAQVHATYYRSDINADFLAGLGEQRERLHLHSLDIRDPQQIQSLSSQFDQVDWIVNCAGYLHGDQGGPEKNIRSVDADFLMENIRINTLPTLLLAKHFSVALKKSPAPKLATVSARVGSIEDNRLGGWYSYRISKAALNMALKTLSIEWKHSHPRGCVAALHPGTNDTPLSKPFQANVAPQHLFDPAYTASHFVELLSQLDSTQSGHFWAWDGTEIPW